MSVLFQFKVSVYLGEMASSTHRSLHGNKEHTQTTIPKQCSAHWRAAKESSVEETFEKKGKLNIYVVREEVKKQNFNVIFFVGIRIAIIAETGI
jgi:hypothetical protein